jgi:hypothetical protein
MLGKRNGWGGTGMNGRFAGLNSFVAMGNNALSIPRVPSRDAVTSQGPVPLLTPPRPERISREPNYSG